MKKTLIPLLLALSMLLSLSVTSYAQSVEEILGLSTDGGGALLEAGYVQCEYCGDWYMEGNDYRNHVLNCPYSVFYEENTDGGGSLIDAGYGQCEYCGSWYMQGNEYRNHVLSCAYNPNNSGYSTSYVQCNRCGLWFMEGNEYRNHVCTGATSTPSSSWSTDDYYNALLKGATVSGTSPIGTVYVNTANGSALNMRARPNTESYVVTSIPNGSAITLYWYENNSWAYVYWSGHYGFCSTRHLSSTVPGSIPAPTVTAAPAAPSASSSATSSATEQELNKMFKGFTPMNFYAAVKPFTPTGVVNLRWAPSTSAPVLCVYSAGTVLRVLSTDGAWSQVLNEKTGVCGFMSNTYLNQYLY